jgi:energy-coupling factor transport system ATP-binding protein
VTQLAVEGLVYDYPGAVRALDGVSLEIAAGESVALIGQNGSGKTTLVKHLNGLLRPMAGRVLVDGKDAAERHVADLAREVGLVFQDPDRQLFSGTVRGEVAFGARNMGRRGSDLTAAVDAALAAVGLADAGALNPYDLGRARRKLLSLAAVLAMDTPVLILDEPTTGQDLAGRNRVAAIIGSATRNGRTVVAVSHDLRFVAENFARVVVLRDGRVTADGPPTSVFAEAGWSTLYETGLEPPEAARIAARLGFTSHVTDADLVRALGGSQ